DISLHRGSGFTGFATATTAFSSSRASAAPWFRTARCLVCASGFRRAKAQCCVRKLLHVLPLGDDDGNVGGHARLELEIVVRKGNYGVVRDNILHGDRS